MWLDKNRQVETEQQKGLYLRVTIAISLLFIGVVIAYFLTEWLYSSGTLTNEFFYNQLSIPSVVNPTTIRTMFVLMLVNSAQIMVIIGMALFNPENQKRLGRVKAIAQRVEF